MKKIKFKPQTRDFNGRGAGERFFSLHRFAGGE